MRFRPPVSTVGRRIESTVMPWVHRKNLFLTVSPSTAESLSEIGVGPDRIRQICNGVVQPDPLTPRSPEPLFLALGRLADYKRIDLLLRLWDRVRHVVGGKLVIAGDGPERARLEAHGRTGRGVHRAGVGGGEAPAAVLGVAADAPGADRRLGHRGRRGGDPRDPRGRLRRAGAARLGRARRDGDAGADRGPVRLGLGLAGHRRAAARGAGPGGAHPGAAAALVGRGGRVCRRGRRGDQARRGQAAALRGPGLPPGTGPPGTGPSGPGGASWRQPRRRRATHSRRSTRTRASRSARARTAPSARHGCWPGSSGSTLARP